MGRAWAPFPLPTADIRSDVADGRPGGAPVEIPLQFVKSRTIIRRNYTAKKRGREEMANEEEDFVFYGTPIGREEEFTSRKKKAVAEAEASGQLRTALPPWKQEVTDEEERRRFHAAFTGGYSAGYYNTVGSKEGWTPQSFTSSRKSRAEVTKQSIFNFLDEDEKADLEGRSLGSSMQFDTFGFTAAELARKDADKDQQQRPSAIPGPVPDELVVPATESIGIKLLIKMGWRPGRSIKDSNSNSLDVSRREARKAFLALSSDAGPNTARSKLTEEDSGKDLDLPANDDDRFYKTVPAYVVDPKQDLYGLGYDPFKQAPEFREKKRQRMSGKGNMEPFRSLTSKGKIGPGFGIGALEDLDAEDEDIYDTGIDVQDTNVQEIEEPSVAKVDTLLDKKKDDVLPGFKAASKSEHELERNSPVMSGSNTPTFHAGTDGNFNAGMNPQMAGMAWMAGITPQIFYNMYNWMSQMYNMYNWMSQMGGMMPGAAGMGGMTPNMAGVGGMMPEALGMGSMTPNMAGMGGTKINSSGEYSSSVGSHELPEAEEVSPLPRSNSRRRRRPMRQKAAQRMARGSRSGSYEVKSEAPEAPGVNDRLACAQLTKTLMQSTLRWYSTHDPVYKRMCKDVIDACRRDLGMPPIDDYGVVIGGGDIGGGSGTGDGDEEE